MIVLIDGAAIVFLILSWWIAFSSYPRLPERIPVHFDLTGKPDRWGGRWMIFLLPLIGTQICAVDWYIINRLSGTPQMPLAMLAPLHFLTLELALLFAYINWRMTEVAFGRAEGLGVWFLLVVLLVILGTVGWMLAAGRTV